MRLDDEQLRWLRNELLAELKSHLSAAGGPKNGPPSRPTGNGGGGIPKRLLTVGETAKYLALSKSAVEHKLHRDAAFRECTVAGFGRRRMFCVKRLEAFLQRNGG